MCIKRKLKTHFFLQYFDVFTKYSTMYQYIFNIYSIYMYIYIYIYIYILQYITIY